MINYGSAVIYSVIIHAVSISALLLVRRYYRISYKGYNDFIFYLVLGFISILLKYVHVNLGGIILLMLAWLTFMFSKFFLLRGLLSFIEEKFSLKFYAIFILISTAVIHTVAVLDMPSYYYILVIMLYNLTIHSFILIRLIRSWSKIKHGKQLILGLNILYIIQFVSLTIIVLRADMKGYGPEFYFWSETTLYNLFSGLMFITVMVLYIDIVYKSILLSKDRLQLAQTISNTGSWEIDISTMMLTGTPLAFEIFGSNTNVYTVSITEIQRNIVKMDRRRVRKALMDLIQKGIPFDVEYRIKVDGGIRFVHSKGELKQYGTTPKSVIGVIVDITDMKEREERLTHISYNDSLTGLYNRRYYEETIKTLNDGNHYPLSIVVIDINGLKDLNDSLGHAAGDRLLVAAAELLTDHIENDDFVSRIGGDEFVFVMPNTSYDEAQDRVKSVIKESENYDVEGSVLSLSLGVATKVTHAIDFSIVFNDAERDMYSMKLIARSSMRGSTINTVLQTLHEKDTYSEEHSRVVSTLSFKLADVMGLSLSQRNNVRMAGILHDIGKIIVSDDILTKQGKLTDEEYEEIKMHSEFGYRILNATNDLRHLCEIVLYHHERYDGSGYPKGLKADQIPLLSRIISVTDAYNAMTSDRSYKATMTKEEAIVELIRCKGTQFDPEITDIFVNKVLKDS